MLNDYTYDLYDILRILIIFIFIKCKPNCYIYDLLIFTYNLNLSNYKKQRNRKLEQTRIQSYGRNILIQLPKQLWRKNLI